MRKPLNYCIVWSENGQRKEEIIFSKASTVVRYVELMREAFDLNISGLTVLEVYENDLVAKDVTSNFNKFLYL